MVTSAGGSCDGTPMRVPVSILPPRSSSSAASALVMDAEAGGDGPAVAMSGGEDAEPDRRGHRVVQRPKGMGRNTSEQCLGLVRTKPPSQGRRGEHGRRTEPGQCQWMARHPEQWSHDVLGEGVKSLRRSAEQRPPPAVVDAESVGGGIDGAVQHSGAAVVERMGTIDLG